MTDLFSNVGYNLKELFEAVIEKDSEYLKQAEAAALLSMKGGGGGGTSASLSSSSSSQEEELLPHSDLAAAAASANRESPFGGGGFQDPRAAAVSAHNFRSSGKSGKSLKYVSN